MLQQEAPDDYVVATGKKTSVRRFCELAFEAAGIELAWEGSGTAEKGYDAKGGQCVVEVDPRYYRPTEVDTLLGDATKAAETLGWTPTTSLKEMTQEMVASDREEARRQQVMARATE
jgi:GDPmannose 4,6-dehydratase